MTPTPNAPAPEPPEEPIAPAAGEIHSLHELLAAVPENIDSIKVKVYEAIRSVCGGRSDWMDKFYANELNHLVGTNNAVPVILVPDGVNNGNDLVHDINKVHEHVLIEENEKAEFRKQIYTALTSPPETSSAAQNTQPTPTQSDQSSRSNQTSTAQSPHATGPAWYRGGNWYQKFMTGSAMEKKEGDGKIKKGLKIAGSIAKWLIDRTNLRSEKYLLRRK